MDYRLRQALCVCAFAAVAVLYFKTTGFELVDYDDTDYVVKNEHLRGGLTLENVRWALVDRGYAANWHPLAWTSLMLDVDAVRLFRLVPPGTPWGEWDLLNPKPDLWYTRLSAVMHAHNVLLHAANAVLLFLLLCIIANRRISDMWILGIALLWALHPLRTEVVCWVSERKELLCVTFMLLSTIFWVCPETRRNYCLSLLFAALALLAKPVAVTLPALLFAWDWIYRGRLSFVRTAPFFLLAFLTGVFTLQSQGESINSGYTMTFASRLSSVFVAPLVYLRQTVWPTGLSVLYEPTRQVNLWVFLVGCLLVVIVVAVSVAWLVRRRGRYLGMAAFGVVWCYVGLMPMLGIIKVGSQEHSDRYTYWVGCGLCAIAVLLLVETAPWLRKAVEDVCRQASGGDEGCESRAQSDCRTIRRLCLVALFAVSGVLGCLTWKAADCWRDTIALYRNAVPRSWDPRNAKILAVVLACRNPKCAQEAEGYLRDCVEHHPCSLSRLNLADFLLAFRKTDARSLALGGDVYAEAEELIEESRRKGMDKEECELAEKLAARIREHRKGAE